MPYRRWCKWCTMARLKNIAHHKLPAFSREIPLLVMDYAFLKSSDDADFLTILVAKVYPYKTIFAVPCPVKGPDAFVTRRMASFLRQCGLTQITYMCDQEFSLTAMMNEALQVVKCSGEWIGAIPERSPVGESQSNGRAERSVQQLEDQVRTLFAELEHNLGTKLPSDHPLLSWLVEYAAVIINKYHPHEEEGKTSYELMHGHDVDERLAMFGEKVFFHVPNKRRSKLDLRWSQGIFLGTTMHSTESYVGLPSGYDIRTNAVARVRSDQCWDKELAQKLTGTPAFPSRLPDDSIIETFDNPHLSLDEDALKLLDVENLEDPMSPMPVSLKDGSVLPSLRITVADLEKFEFSSGCPRCTDLQLGRTNTRKNHSDDCRRRVYQQMWLHQDPKILKWLREHPVDRAKVGPSIDVEYQDMDQAPASVRAALLPGGKMGTSDPADLPKGTPGRPMPETSPAAASSSSQGRASHNVVVAEDLDESDFRTVTSLLVHHGVEPVEAQRFVTSTVRAHNKKSFFEMYGQGGLSRTAEVYKGLNVVGLRALDLRTLRPDGKAWDFSRRSDRDWAFKLVQEEEPDWIIGSPPCTSFSALNHGFNYPKMDAKEVDRRWREGMIHLKFMCKLYRHQLRHNKFFLHEHPRGAKSWSQDCIRRLLQRNDVNVALCHQCAFGAEAKTDDGGSELILKPTRFMSNSLPMLKELGKECDRKHRHQHLLSGRAAGAAFYPLKLMKAILRGISRTADATQSLQSLQEEEYDTHLLMSIAPLDNSLPSHDPASSADSNSGSSSTLPIQGGGQVRIDYQPCHFS